MRRSLNGRTRGLANYTFKNLGHVGRLGNQMFQIAWAYTQSLINNTHASIRPDWEYRHVFSLPESLYEPSRGNAIDGGTEYYQDISLWNEFTSRVWDMFQPSQEALNRLNEYVGPDFDAENGCSVHYRRGDYLKNPKHFPIPTPGYYAAALKEVLGRNGDTVFYVFSDDISAMRKEYQKFPDYKTLLDRVVFFDGDITPVEVEDRKGEPLDWLDLFAMQSCSNHIIANSTFSWWGGFLSNNPNVIYPSKWFGTDPAVRNIPWRLMIPDTWTEVQC